MERLGKNKECYCGETIDSHAVLRDIEIAAPQHGWTSEIFFQENDLRLLALTRATRNSRDGKPGDDRETREPDRKQRPRIYISSGIHGDEPAGPLAIRRLIQENRWPGNADLWLCPCLNPAGFALNRRGNAKGIDLNREYRTPAADDIRAHIEWLDRQPQFDLCLLLHEDWEAHGFYLYEQNPDNQPSPAQAMIDRVASVCPIDRSDMIEGRPANGGIIRPNMDPRMRPDWPEAFYVITHKTRLSFTLEAPSDYPMPVRVAALVTAVNTAVESVAAGIPQRRS